MLYIATSTLTSVLHVNLPYMELYSFVDSSSVEIVTYLLTSLVIFLLLTYLFFHTKPRLGSKSLK